MGNKISKDISQTLELYGPKCVNISARLEPEVEFACVQDLDGSMLS